MHEIIGVVAGLFEVLAVYFVGPRKNKYGFLIGIMCNIFWVAFVVFTHSAWGLLIVCPLAFIMNVRGFRRWKKDEDEESRELHRESNS